MKHKFTIEPVGRTGLRAYCVCGHCGVSGEFLRFGRWATTEFLRKLAIQWLKGHDCPKRAK